MINKMAVLKTAIFTFYKICTQSRTFAIALKAENELDLLIFAIVFKFGKTCSFFMKIYRILCIAAIINFGF